MTRTKQCQFCMFASDWLKASGALALAAIFVTTIMGTSVAQAQTYTVLHKFLGGRRGSFPASGHLIGDLGGNLYGTSGGGSSNFGLVFKLDKTGEKVLYSFNGGADGSYPNGGLIQDSAGNLYGTAGGGASGFGVVFKLDASGNETVLYNFKGNPDGVAPMGGLIRDSAGNLYGTTLQGGASDFGTVFKLDTTGKETTLYQFMGADDGFFPRSGVIRDSVGNLYGTAWGGAAQHGVVFKVDTTGNETVLYYFNGDADGTGPEAGLIRDSAGNFYGTTPQGGGPPNSGIVFKLDNTGKETVLYTFTGGADGLSPNAVIQDSAGNLYGTTNYGGASGLGVVFKLDTSGKETVLHSFTGADGAYPLGGLIRGSAGNLYGTTSSGGVATTYCGAAGCGVIFKLEP